VTETAAFAANTSGTSINVTLLGTLVPLPDDQILSPDITVDANSEVFTINTSGRYRISYQVNVTLGIAMGARILHNGSPVVQSTIIPLLSLSAFSNEIIIDINAGDTIALQLFGIVGLATLISDGAGATLMIIRLS